MSNYRLDYVEDGLLIGSDCAWAWFRLPTHSYDALSEGQRLALLAQEERLLSGLRDAEGHLLIVPRSYPALQWAADLQRRTTRPAPGWSSYLDAVTNHLSGQRIRQREVYLGLRLNRPPRGSWIRNLFVAQERLTGLEDPRPSASELRELRKGLDLMHRTVAAARPGAQLPRTLRLWHRHPALPGAARCWPWSRGWCTTDSAHSDSATARATATWQRLPLPTCRTTWNFPAGPSGCITTSSWTRP